MSKKSKSDWLLLRVSQLAVVSAWRPELFCTGYRVLLSVGLTGQWIVLLCNSLLPL